MKAFRCLAAGLAVAAAAASSSAPPKIAYPPARTVDQTDTYHGITVRDPYRWLEADPGDSPEVAAWIEAQNRVTATYLQSIPERQAIRERLRRLWDYEAEGTPERQGGRLFIYKNDGRQEKAVLYTRTSPDAAPRVLIDPNQWPGSADLTNFSASRDGRHLAYGISDSGSDWQTYRLMEIETGKVLPEELHGIKTCCSEWTEDGQGFFYGRFPVPQKSAEKDAALEGPPLHHRIYYHRVGTPESADTVVYERPDQPDWMFWPTVTDDGRYLLIYIARGTGERIQILVRDLASPEPAFRDLVPRFESRYMLLAGNQGSLLFFRTDLEAPNGRLIAIDAEKPERERWKEILPASENPLRYVARVGDLFLARYLEHGRTRVKIFNLDGRYLRDVDLPGIGAAAGFEGGPRDADTYYSFSSWTTPPSSYRYDLASGRSTRIWQARIDVDSTAFEVRQVFYTSKDGTRVPLFLLHRKGLALDGSHPTLLYGYGGFNNTVPLNFSAILATWVEMGGVYAAPGLRGGGEYGEAWHEAGTKTRKQNVFDDFLAAAEWLIANRYTRQDKLAIQGESNGGLLVGAAMTQRPDLFAAALPRVGVMDMLRYDKFSAGRTFVSEYGSAEDPTEFRALYAYSPYHNLKAGTRYPATLVMTADHDNRVVPAHSFKFAARLQHDQAGEAPVLLLVQTGAGHGGGAARSQSLEGFTDQWAFLVKALGMKLPEGFGKPPL